MTSQPTISFVDKKLPETGTLVLFAASGKRYGELLPQIDKATDGQVTKAIDVMRFEGGEKEIVDLILPVGLKAARLLIVGIGEFKNATTSDFTSLGGRLSTVLRANKAETITVMLDNIGDDVTYSPEAAAAIATGYQLKHYKFRKYKTIGKDKDKEKKHSVKRIYFGCDAPGKCSDAYAEAEPLRAGIELARDLVNEPANILGPVEFALKALELEKFGVTVTTFDEEEMAAKGMNALLAVGQGSSRGSRLAVMHWNGSNNENEKPLAIVGKGVCFDTGGISIKPSQGMEDMKGDMGGAACVTGLIRTLAGRKAKVNVVGIIGLVENMPDGKAQRPGDIVTSMSGQTIEVLNTDAEGRLVLADALWYAKEHYKPKVIIDLATLTGAILVALGKEYAGLFSNNDRLANRLVKAGVATGEKLWRMPLGKKYDKMIDSQVADMKNIGDRYAGSITAAQFLKRFVGDVPWAHIDVAGTAMASPKTDINDSWGSGFGVTLLNEFIARNYE